MKPYKQESIMKKKNGTDKDTDNKKERITGHFDENDMKCYLRYKTIFLP